MRVGSDIHQSGDPQWGSEALSMRRLDLERVARRTVRPGTAAARGPGPPSSRAYATVLGPGVNGCAPGGRSSITACVRSRTGS
eukprot:8369824-Alexandrium_andersonii.AAC.2